MSPPQVSVKDEDDYEDNSTLRSLIVAPYATMKSLVLIKDILIAAVYLRIDNKNNSTVVDKQYN